MKALGKVLRCAVYARKSMEERFQQEFNSLHAQREACEAYIPLAHVSARRFLNAGQRKTQPAIA